MNTTCARIFCGLAMSLILRVAIAQEQETPKAAKSVSTAPERAGSHIVGNGEVAATLSSGKVQERITGA